MSKHAKRLLISLIVIVFLPVLFFCCVHDEATSEEIRQEINEMGGSYEEVQANYQRWKTLNDTVDYAINNPRIDKKHPNISLSLNPAKIENKNKNKLPLSSIPLGKSIDRYESVKLVLDYERIQEVYSDAWMLQCDTFEKLLQLEKMIKNKETDYKLLYWTFDDGPYAKTDKFLKRLDKYHIQATFFTTSINGKYCFDDRKKLTAPFYKKYVKYGHTIGNHTYTHGLGRGLYDSKKNFVNAVLKQEDYITGLTGYMTEIYRFPGGSLTAGSLKNPIIKALRKEGYAWVDWTAQTGDGGALKSEKQAYRNFKVSMGEPIEVLLCHDYSEKTYRIMPKMIKYARNHRYIFAPLFYESKALNH